MRGGDSFSSPGVHPPLSSWIFPVRWLGMWQVWIGAWGGHRVWERMPGGRLHPCGEPLAVLHYSCAGAPGSHWGAGDSEPHTRCPSSSSVPKGEVADGGRCFVGWSCAGEGSFLLHLHLRWAFWWLQLSAIAFGRNASSPRWTGGAWGCLAERPCDGWGYRVAKWTSCSRALTLSQVSEAGCGWQKLAGLHLHWPSDQMGSLAASSCCCSPRGCASGARQVRLLPSPFESNQGTPAEITHAQHCGFCVRRDGGVRLLTAH